MYIKKKNLVLIFFFICLLYFVVVDFRELIEFFQFDVNAPDLTADGMMLRNKFFKSYYEPKTIFTFLIRYSALLLPIIIFIGLYYYNKLKKKVLKNVIGKAKNINNYLLVLKFKIALLPIAIFWGILLIYTFVSWYLTGLRVRPGADFSSFIYPTLSYLQFLNDSLAVYLILLFLGSALYILATVLMLTTIIDYNYNYIVVFVLYFLITYITTDFMTMYITRFNYLTASFGILGGGILTYSQLIISYIYMAIVYLLFKVTHKKEF